MDALRVAVVGGGSWGTGFAVLLAGRGHDVLLAVRDPARAAEIAAARENARYLPGVALPAVVTVEAATPAEACAGRDLVVLAVPSRAFAATCEALRPGLSGDAVLLSLAKGLDPASGARLSTVAASGCGVDAARVAVLSGPNHAEEVARGAPAATVVASSSAELAERLRDAVSTATFRAYSSADVVGVELCAAAKNVIALAAGVSDGLGFGDNAKASLITRGLAEMARLGASFGADERTFAGLAGLGDLVATCCSAHSRNRAAGELLARGVPPAELEARIGMVAEGLTTAPVLRRVARARGLELPIAERVCAVLEGEPPREATARLLARPLAAEQRS
jgi:glycerol-3-phosphate dehydrogenase (NAD(P)+)